MPTTLSKMQQERVARALVQEYGQTLGITLQAARNRVATGDWDDHPVAKRLLATLRPGETALRKASRHERHDR